MSQVLGFILKSATSLGHTISVSPLTNASIKVVIILPYYKKSVEKLKGYCEALRSLGKWRYGSVNHY